MKNWAGNKNWIGVVPCFNEEKRLQPSVFLQALDQAPGLIWVFVNDGSKDGTQDLLQRMQAAQPNRIQVLSLATNQGKSEAVRQGLLFAKEFDPWAVGYFDADLATPAEEFIRLAEILKEVSAQAVIGSRMFLKGRKIKRSFIRYFLGRCFSVPASILLKTRFQDTQCGAKIFRWTPLLEDSLQQRFVSTWLFDIELIHRLISAPKNPYHKSDFFEEPLRQWTEIGNSKIKPASFMTALWDLVKIFLLPSSR